jgi:hypothetical protein
MSINEKSTAASRYLANQLTDAERADYEALLTQSAAALAELEATARLKVGLEKLREKQEVPGLLRPAGHPRWTYLLPLAAGVAALGIGTALWQANHAGSVPLLNASLDSLVDNPGHALPIVATTAIYRKRAGASDVVIEVPASRGILEWRWTPHPSAASHHYDAVLMQIREDETLATVGAVDGLSPDDSGVVKWYADTSRLVPGRYKLTLTEQVQRGQPPRPETFLINVRMGAK